jgi:hypothetical protein
VLDSLAQPHGMGFFIYGQTGQGKTTFLRDIQTALWATGPTRLVVSSSPALRWSRLKLGDRRYLLCAPSLSSWSAYPAVPLQGILAAELSVAVPHLHLPLSSSFFTRGQFTDALANEAYEGLVVLADDLDRLLSPERPSYLSDLAFLEELGAMISVYLLPVWLLFTLTQPLAVGRERDQVGSRLRNRFTTLHLQPPRLGTWRAR